MLKKAGRIVEEKAMLSGNEMDHQQSFFGEDLPLQLDERDPLLQLSAAFLG